MFLKFFITDAVDIFSWRKKKIYVDCVLWRAKNKK